MTTTIQNVIDFVDTWRANNNLSVDHQLSAIEVEKLSTDLQAKVGEMSFILSGKPGANALPYSGAIGNANAPGWQVAAAISANSDGKFVYISDIDPGKLLNSTDFKASVLTAVGENETVLDALLNGSRETDGTRSRYGAGEVLALNDFVSKEFMLANAKGNVLTLTPKGAPDNVWAQTEFPTLLTHPDVTHINGIPVEDLRQMRTDILATGTTATQADINTANKIVLDYVNQESAIQARNLQLQFDSENKLVGVGTREYFNNVGMTGVGYELTSAPGYKVEYANTLKVPETAAEMDALRNAVTGNQMIRVYDQQRVSAFEAVGDLARAAESSKSLSRANAVGMVLGLMTIGSQAFAAEKAGNHEQAKQIVADGLLAFAEGAVFFGGVQLAATAIGLVIGLPLGALVGGFLAVYGLYEAAKLVPALFDSIASLFTAATVATPPVRRDPLVFDLDGDGLETTGLNATNPIYFDHNADGVKTATGWVGADDAFLVLDKNANGSIDNGRELFGDAFIKSNGQLAADGFDALRDLDANADGKINAGDAPFANLRLWRDLNQDGVSQANELFTLGSQNIAAINAGSTAHSQILANGNQLADLGSYVKTDGSVATLGEVTGNLGDINLVQDTFHSRFTDTLDTSAVATLPDMQGAGQVRSLREAATLSPVLAQLLTDFAAATSRDAQQALIDPILKAWSDTSIMPTTFNGAYAGHALTANGLPAAGTAERQAWENKISLLERFNGRPFNTVPAGTAVNDKTWRIAA